jgi:hypothetical protein
MASNATHPEIREVLISGQTHSGPRPQAVTENACRKGDSKRP